VRRYGAAVAVGWRIMDNFTSCGRELSPRDTARWAVAVDELDGRGGSERGGRAHDRPCRWPVRSIGRAQRSGFGPALERSRLFCSGGRIPPYYVGLGGSAQCLPAVLAGDEPWSARYNCRWHVFMPVWQFHPCLYEQQPRRVDRVRTWGSTTFWSVHLMRRQPSTVRHGVGSKACVLD